MLASNARYKPCIALWRFCSVGLSTVTVPLSFFIMKSGSIAWCNSPLGPFMETLRFSLEKLKVTPEGIVIGFLPMRDMSFLINRRNTKLHHQYSLYEPLCR